MKIGFDVSQTGKLKAGCGFFADTLIRNLAELDRENQYLLYPTFGDLYWDPEWPSGVCRIHRLNFQSLPLHESLHEASNFWNHPPADFEKQMGEPDLIHSNNFFCPTALKDIRLVYTLYDLSFLIHPDWTTEENRTGCFKGVFNASLYADLIIAISHFSRNHFLEVFPHYSPDRVEVVYPASRFDGVRDIPHPQKAAHLSPNRFWLNVGVREPRKNHLRLLKAYALLKQGFPETFPLVFAGGQGWLTDDFQKQLDSLNLGANIISLGYVDDETLQWLYQNCFAFVYPTLFEGFGLPVLEAMSLGAPVITSNVSSIPEIVGDAGIMIDPFQEKELFQAMRRLVVEPSYRIALQERGLRRAAQFSWSFSASRIMELYRSVYRQKPRSSNLRGS